MVLASVDHRGEIFEVDLVDDSGARRHNRKIMEGFLRPTEQGVTLVVSLELTLHVEAEGVCETEVIHLYRVIDDKVSRDDRVDALGVAAECLDAVSHCGQVDDSRHAREVLEDDACGHERQVSARVGGAPLGYGLHMLLGHVAPAGVAKRVLEKDADRKGKAIQRVDEAVVL